MNEQAKLASDNLLLKEYELCQASAQRLESTIWQTFAVIGVVSIATLVAVAKAPPDIVVAVIVGVFVIGTTFVWWFMARRWWSIQHAAFLRMQHIEECIGSLYQQRYVKYLDGLCTLMSQESDCSKLTGLRELQKRWWPLDSKIRKHLHGEMSNTRKNHQLAGIQVVLRYFVVLNAAVWIVYVAYCMWHMWYMWVSVFCGLIRSW